MKKRWYWFWGVERWPGGFQVGLGWITIHCNECVPFAWWFNRD